MIQMTLIQIDNYGPWTVTPRPRTESDLQILQAELFADTKFGKRLTTRIARCAPSCSQTGDTPLHWTGGAFLTRRTTWALT